jgi:hypothetical protein
MLGLDSDKEMVGMLGHTLDLPKDEELVLETACTLDRELDLELSLAVQFEEFQLELVWVSVKVSGLGDE